MRILLSCLQAQRKHRLPAYDFWRTHFTKGCEDAGIEYVEVPHVDWAEALLYSPGSELDQWRARTWETVLAFVRREHVRQPFDFFLSYFYPQHIDVAAIKEIQKAGIPCVNFFCDNYREYNRVPPEYEPFTLHWVPEYEALPIYRDAGLPHLHAPMPCWVRPELRDTPQNETEPVTFLGSADILRRDLLGRGLASGADFVIRGAGWTGESAQKPSRENVSHSWGSLLSNQWELIKSQGCSALAYKMINRLRPLHPPVIDNSRIHSVVSDEDYLRISREARITIGVNRVPTTRASNHHPLTYSRLRDLEAPMLGACYLTEWTVGLGQLYDLGTEIETYRTPEELVDKMKELNGNSARRKEMRKRGQKRALSDHSTARTLGRIVNKLGLSAT